MVEQKKSGPYTEDDFTYVVDGDGNMQPDPVPKAWVGTSLLPDGFKAASKAASRKAQTEGDDPGDPGDPAGTPPPA